MQEVDGEAHPAQEQQGRAGEDLLQVRAEQDTGRDELEPDAGAEPAIVRVQGEDPLHKARQHARPCHPVGVRLGIRRKGEPDEDEEAR